jgi:nucleotide-binding universal stress UspA family protein
MAVLEFKPDAPVVSGHGPAVSIRNVLYATDFSAPSELALPYASAICRRFGSTLHIVHVLSDANIYLMSGGVDYVSAGAVYEDTHILAQEKIQQVSARLGTIPLRSYIRHGSVCRNLKEIVAANGIDLIVVGTHGRTGMGKLLLGSVAEKILRNVPCPVLTVGPNVRGRARLPEMITQGREVAPVELELRNILFATNLTADSKVVAPVAVSLAAEFGAAFTLMHVFEHYPDLSAKPGPIEAAVEQLHSLVPKDATLAYPPEVVMEFGSAPKCIVNTAVQRDADLIVLGARPADLTSHLPWTTVHEVAAYAPCPVLTVPAKQIA